MLELLRKFRIWHEDQIFGFQNAMRIDDYHMLWFAFGKGVLFTAILFWIL